MSGFPSFWQQGDLITRSVAVLLLLMSVSAWVVIFWKGWLLRRVRTDIQRAVPAFWSAPDLAAGRVQLAAFDREGVLEPLLAAAIASPNANTLEARGHVDSQLTRRLRDALHAVLAQLQYGQVLLASIGSTAPFIGLFGTVWSPTMSPPRIVAKPIVDGSRSPVMPSRPYTAHCFRSRPSAWATTSPIASAVPLGASTLWRWCASMTSMS